MSYFKIDQMFSPVKSSRFQKTQSRMPTSVQMHFDWYELSSPSLITKCCVHAHLDVAKKNEIKKT